MSADAEVQVQPGEDSIHEKLPHGHSNVDRDDGGLGPGVQPRLLVGSGSLFKPPVSAELYRPPIRPFLVQE